MSTYKEKYLKYKQKYIQLKNQIGGSICPFCYKRITTFEKLVEHIRLNHNMEISEDEIKKNGKR